ncbi:hypothetical protein [Oceanispirochaeta sp.]|jgi:hypothetical protein|uniref:hypothetical protein n=1 Tax=Oceanispirochaeta sp. TaxID=2035350 RepID=UPI00262EB0C2|nr:hypothetical protein [Oceanispirochaeta sp.]MDA3957434.1 hypothetical protein [Oceanispirochaeta sp.]
MVKNRKDSHSAPTVEKPDESLPVAEGENHSEIKSFPGAFIPSKSQNPPPQTEESTPKPFPPLAELKADILRVLRQDRHSLAAAMEKSGHWDFNENILSLSFNSPFESTFIEKESREIESIIKGHLGWTVQIKTVIKEEEDSILNEEIEEQVELVLNVFRGTIVNRSEI